MTLYWGIQSVGGIMDRRWVIFEFSFLFTGENAFHLSPEIRKHCDWFQNDRPASTSQDRTTYDEYVIYNNTG